MINYNEATDKSNYNITDSQKFLIMSEAFNDVFVNDKTFGEKIGAGKSIVNNWRRQKTLNIKKAKFKANICKVFGLVYNTWSREFPTEDSFREELVNLKKIRNSTEKLDRYIMKNNDIESETVESLFDQAKEYAKQDKIGKALILIRKIENSESNFLYKHKNEIQHEKAKLLSTDVIRDWDGAIHILKDLYFSAQYHLKEHEIITLIASNYKRKALFDDNGEYREKADIHENSSDLLAQSLALYDEAYELKDSQEKYYDAINFAYLYKIIDKIEDEESDDNRVNELYRELKQFWRIDNNSWWEVVSNAEFLMLTGDTRKAISNVEIFLEQYNDKVSDSDISGTFRQLKIYIHFTQDKNAIEFYEFLRISWEAIRQGKIKNNIS